MPNPHGTLAGWSDPEEPGWEERVLKRVHDRQRQNKTGQAARRPVRLQVFAELPFRHLLNEAAEKRGIAIGSYIRRSVAAFIAHDLGIPFSEVTKNFPRAYPYNVPSGGWQTTKRTSDNGEGYGDWTVR